MEAEKASSGSAALPPAVPPFLMKCYDMVDDPATNETVSWSKNNNSFAIWDPHAFSRDLIPKYFKHNNFSSFVRQLNTYGFRKVDPDRWVFANDGFLKGQKHLLETITRKKPTQTIVPQQNTHGQNTSVKACVEVGKFGLEEEIERLKRDKNVLMQELVKLRHHQQNTDQELHNLRQRFQEMEQSQQQMMSLLVMALQRPNILAQLVQQNVNSRWIGNANKKRRLPVLKQGGASGFEACDGQIIKYQPFVAETSEPGLMPVLNADVARNLEPRSDGFSDFCTNVDTMSLGPQSLLPAEGDILPFDISAYFEQLLASPHPENNGEIDPNLETLPENNGEIAPNAGLPDFALDFDFSRQDIHMGTSQNVVLPNEQMQSFEVDDKKKLV